MHRLASVEEEVMTPEKRDLSILAIVIALSVVVWFTFGGCFHKWEHTVNAMDVKDCKTGWVYTITWDTYLCRKCGAYRVSDRPLIDNHLHDKKS
jgi:hypothetical protein